MRKQAVVQTCSGGSAATKAESLHYSSASERSEA